MITQKDMILEYLQTSKEITQRIAFDRFGCTRLAARISDLRREGHNISRRIETGEDRYGQSVWYAVYKLEEEAV